MSHALHHGKCSCRDADRSKIDMNLHIPIRTILLTGLVNVCLGLIDIGSSTAFNAIVSLVVSSYLSSYLIPILLMIRRRVLNETVHFGPWHLGRWGLPINVIAACYTFVTVIFTFFPVAVPVTAENMNYSCAVYGGVVLLGLVYYGVWGRKIYRAPKTYLVDE